MECIKKNFAMKAGTILLTFSFLTAAQATKAQETNFDHVNGIDAPPAAYKQGMSDKEAKAHIRHMKERNQQKTKDMKANHQEAIKAIDTKKNNAAAQPPSVAHTKANQEPRNTFQDRRQRVTENFHKRHQKLKEKRIEHRQGQGLEEKLQAHQERRREAKKEHRGNYQEQHQTLRKNKSEHQDIRKGHHKNRKEPFPDRMKTKMEKNMSNQRIHKNDPSVSNIGQKNNHYDNRTNRPLDRAGNKKARSRLHRAGN